MLGAVLPLVGVFLGAALQYWLSRSSESRKQLEILQRQAYVDYLRAVAKVAHAQSPEAHGTAVTDAADAKARIAIYGSAPAVEALARFEESGPVLNNPRSVDCFLRLASVMRLKGHQPTKDALRLVLLGQDQGLPGKPLRPTEPRVAGECSGNRSPGALG